MPLLVRADTTLPAYRSATSVSCRRDGRRIADRAQPISTANQARHHQHMRHPSVIIITLHAAIRTARSYPPRRSTVTQCALSSVLCDLR
jgi:hypothetical protein